MNRRIIFTRACILFEQKTSSLLSNCSAKLKRRTHFPIRNLLTKNLEHERRLFVFNYLLLWQILIKFCLRLTCTALLRKQLFCPGPLSRPFVLVKVMESREGVAIDRGWGGNVTEDDAIISFLQKVILQMLSIRYYYILFWKRNTSI